MAWTLLLALWTVPTCIPSRAAVTEGALGRPRDESGARRSALPRKMFGKKHTRAVRFGPSGP
jgi:hypothetical protein